MKKKEEEDGHEHGRGSERERMGNVFAIKMSRKQNNEMKIMIMIIIMWIVINNVMQHRQLFFAFSHFFLYTL